MSYYASPEALASNPPESWRIVRRPIGSRVRWALYIEDGPVHYMAFDTRREAIAERDDPNSHTRREVEQERQWYAGTTPNGWRAYADCIAAE